MKKFIAILMLAVILVLGGCAETTTSNSGKGSIDPAVFRMGEDRVPRISIKEDGTFLITYTVMAERLTTGTYSVSEDEILTLEADDGAVYNFKIERDGIVFIGETSTPFEQLHESEPEILDGAKFDLWRKY